NWDPERGDLLTWLKWVIRSEISHLAESASNRLEVRVDQVDDHTSNQSNFDDGHPKKALQTTSLEDEVISGEAETEKSKDASLKIDSLLETCSGKPELEEIVFAIIDGRCDAKPQELAKYLGRPVEKINLAIRALRRRALKIKMEAQNGRE
ncbi:MAG: hypothetical protein GYA55_00535, partial [SAR324 cluster bacterium]|nr:hypothetical protein [SAR324 cluster bacterium]